MIGMGILQSAVALMIWKNCSSGMETRTCTTDLTNCGRLPPEVPMSPKNLTASTNGWRAGAVDSERATRTMQRVSSGRTLHGFLRFRLTKNPCWTGSRLHGFKSHRIALSLQVVLIACRSIRAANRLESTP